MNSIRMAELFCVGGAETSKAPGCSVLIELPNVIRVKLVCNSVCLVFVNKAHGLYLWILILFTYQYLQVYTISQVSDLLH